MDALNTPPTSTPPDHPGPVPVRGASPPPGGGSFLARLPRPRWWQVLLLLLVAPAVGVLSFFAVWAGTFDISRLGDMPQRATVYDMDGNQYSTLRASENRILVPIDQVSPLFLQALVAREDTRFYSHHGVDPHGIARAILRNITRHHIAEGASTLTQQLARNSLPLGGKTLTRKILEAFVALRIERHYTKRQILGFYVNRIYYGAGVNGIETASQTYFDKPSAKLDLSEAAMMAGLIRSPSRFSPLNNPDAAARERDTVLDRMAALQMITPAQDAAAKQEKIVVSRNRVNGVQQDYAMDGVQAELNTLLTDEQEDEGGLKIYTTIDPQLQTAATQAVEAQLEKIENRPGYEHPKKGQTTNPDERQGTDYLEGALVAIDNRDGSVRAVVGGREYRPGGFNRATQPPGRPVGSTVKPFVYTAAWQRGLLPGANISDGAIESGELPDAPNWHPGNSDGTFGGILPAEVGLIRSRNTMSVRVGELVGLDGVRRVDAAAGLGDNIPPDPTIFLGTFDVTLAKLTEAYTLFPNWGKHRPAHFIERIDGADGTMLYRAGHPDDQQPLQAGAAWMTHSILEKVMQRGGTAADARALGFTGHGAGKTGTTNDFRDAWFVGYTTSLTCGVWVGLDHPQTITAKGYGAALALPIWCQVMSKASAGKYPSREFQPPEALKRVRVCAFSNQLANDGCEAAGTAYTMVLPASKVPRMVCTVHQGQVVLPGQEGLAAPGESPAPTPDPQHPDAFPKRFFRSFRKLFGG